MINSYARAVICICVLTVCISLITYWSDGEMTQPLYLRFQPTISSSLHKTTTTTPTSTTPPTTIPSTTTPTTTIPTTTTPTTTTTTTPATKDEQIPTVTTSTGALLENQTSFESVSYESEEDELPNEEKVAENNNIEKINKKIDVRLRSNLSPGYQAALHNMISSNRQSHYFKYLSRSWIMLTPEGVDKLEKPNLHELSQHYPYDKRMLEMKHRCKSQQNDHKVDLSRFIYDDKRKVVMCVVPKNACTSWKRFFWYFMGNDDYKTVSSGNLVLTKGKLPRLSSLKNKTAAFEKLESYTRFFVQRDPYERLISAHNSKFTQRSRMNEYKNNYGRRAARIFTPRVMSGIPVRSFFGKDGLAKLERFPMFQRLSYDQKREIRAAINTTKTGLIDFHMFIKLVLYQAARVNHKLMDVHWRPQTDLCNPCAINYDYVVEFENLAQDSNRLLAYLQRNDPAEKRVFFEENQSMINPDLTRQTMSRVSVLELAKLRALYAKDFEALGYR